jgi:MFS family permease
MVHSAIGLSGDAASNRPTARPWQGLFHRLWAAQTIALFGAEIAVLAIPLTAALFLGATPLQMGLLVAAGEAPFLLCSLPLGVFVDRVRRRPLLIGADLGRVLLLAMIPLASLLGALRIELLYIVTFLVGVLTVLFDIAHFAYFPSLVPRESLLHANGRLQVSHSASASIGPGLAGLLVQALTAPLAVIGTAVSFLISGSMLATLRHPEPSPSRPDGPVSTWRDDIAAGLHALLGHALLRPIVIASALMGIFLYAIRATYILFATRELQLDAFQLGLILAAGGLAAIPGGLFAGRVASLVGFGRSIWGGWMLMGASLLLLPLATPSTAIVVLVVAQGLSGLAETIANVNQWSLRQALTPDHLQGRVTASHRFLVYGAFPIGALLGGILASHFGLRPTILACAVGLTLSPLYLLFTPLRGVHASPIDSPSSEMA